MMILITHKQYLFHFIEMNTDSQILAISAAVMFTYSKQSLNSPVIACLDSASYSCILTMAEYLCRNYPDLTPPGFPEDKIKVDIQHTLDEKKQIKLYFQPWCDYFNELMEKRQKHAGIAQKDGVMYLVCNVKEDYYNKLLTVLDLSLFKLQSWSTAEELFNNTPTCPYTKTKKKLKVGIINFSLSQIKSDHFTPKVNLLSLFTGIWFKCGDQWRRYDVLKGEYPTQEDMQQTNIFILSGSTMSVNDNNPHVEKVMSLLKKGYQENKKLKILGLCFGHQAVAKYFGGLVQKKQLYSGIQLVTFNKNLVGKFPYLKNIENFSIPLSAFIMEFHNDYVTKLPEFFLPLASSKSCENQSMISQDGRFLTFQYHTQYTYGYCKDFQIKISKHFKQDIYKTDYKLQTEVLQKYGVEKHLESCRIIREIVRNFIEWKVE